MHTYLLILLQIFPFVMYPYKKLSRSKVPGGPAGRKQIPLAFLSFQKYTLGTTD